MLTALNVIVIGILLQIGGCMSLIGMAQTRVSPANVTVMDNTLIDFSDEREVEAWFPVNDDVMGGVSQSRVDATGDGSILFSGNISFDNNGGFATTQVNFNPPLDLRAYQGFEIRLRGDGKLYGLYLDDRYNAINHQANFSTEAGVWQDVRVPFADFEAVFFGEPTQSTPLNLSNILSLSFIIENKQEGLFELEIARIGVY